MEHRRTFNAIRGIDYSKHVPELLRIVPPETIIDRWREDYAVMCRGFIYGAAPDFDDLCNQLRDIEGRLHAMATERL